MYLVLDERCDEERVLKVINKSKSQMPAEELQLEIDTLKALDHPHIIRLFEYFEDYNNVYIVMETARGKCFILLVFHLVSFNYHVFLR